MKIKIICIGKIKEAFYRDAIAEYSKRISKFSSFEIVEMPDEKDSDKENLLSIEKEGERILSNIKNGEYVVSLCIEGKKFSSTDFADRLSTIFVNGYNTIDFIIGGSWGLSDKVKQRSDIKMSFSDMTFPHQLMRVILSEQIYRCFKIINNEPYHK